MTVMLYGEEIGSDGMPLEFFRYQIYGSGAPWAGENKVCFTAVNIYSSDGHKRPPLHFVVGLFDYYDDVIINGIKAHCPPNLKVSHFPKRHK